MPGPMARIVAITIVFQTTLFALRPMVSYRALDLGADPVQLGAVTGAFSLLSLFVAIPAGRWVDRRGEAPAIILGAALMAAVSAGLALAGSLVALVFCQALLGSAHVINVVGIQALLANRATTRQRDRRFAMFTTSASFGQLLGPAGAGVLASVVGGAQAASRGSVAVFVAGIGLSLVATALALPLPRRPRPAPSAAHRAAPGPALLGVVRLPSMPHAILVSVTVMTTVEILTMYLPAYGEANGLSVQEVSLLLSIRAAASLASRFHMTWLVERFGRRTLLIACTVVPAVLLCGWPLMDGFGPLAASMTVIGLGLGLAQPLTLTWVAGRVPAAARGAALGLRLSANRFGQMSIPLAVGVVAGSVGISSIFFSMAALLGVSSAAAGRASFGDVEARKPRA
jgi:MFS family permease